MEQLISIIENLCLNLCTEIIGILITVFVIDKLIKRREESRWQKVKGAMYANILNTLTDTIRQLPDELRQPEKPMVYYYGNSTVIINYEIKEKLTKDVQAILEKESKRNGGFNFNAFFIAKQRISEIANSSVSLLDPTLTELLLIFEQQVSILKEKASEQQSINNKQETISQISSLIVRSTLNLNSWLIKQADKRITLDEHLKNILK